MGGPKIRETLPKAETALRMHMIRCRLRSPTSFISNTVPLKPLSSQQPQHGYCTIHGQLSELTMKAETIVAARPTSREIPGYCQMEINPWSKCGTPGTGTDPIRPPHQLYCAKFFLTAVSSCQSHLISSTLPYRTSFWCDTEPITTCKIRTGTSTANSKHISNTHQQTGFPAPAPPNSGTFM